MASEKPAVIVIISTTALDELFEIWKWNVQHHGVRQADVYDKYLKEQIYGLKNKLSMTNQLKGTRPFGQFSSERNQKATVMSLY